MFQFETPIDSLIIALDETVDSFAFYKKLGRTELIIYGFTLPEFASSMACLMVLA